MIEKSAMIAITGRPNVGKSTLMNRLVGEKIAIVSNKPQTTRNRISGVVSYDDTQLVFLDTPGFHKPRTKLGSYMVNVVTSSVTDVDAVMLVVEPIAAVGEQEAALLEHIRTAGCPCVLVINKIDTVEKETLLAVIAAYSQKADFVSVIPVSARDGDGLELLKDELCKLAQPGPQLFPEDMITDQPERQIVAETIREKLLWCLEREVPHGTAVEISRFREREDGMLEIDATIYCEKASHKGIIIGKGGTMLKKISTMAREDCEKFFDAKVYLQTWVKVKENWRESDFLIRNFGYEM